MCTGYLYTNGLDWTARANGLGAFLPPSVLMVSHLPRRPSASPLSNKPTGQRISAACEACADQTFTDSNIGRLLFSRGHILWVMSALCRHPFPLSWEGQPLGSAGHSESQRPLRLEKMTFASTFSPATLSTYGMARSPWHMQTGNAYESRYGLLSHISSIMEVGHQA